MPLSKLSSSLFQNIALLFVCAMNHNCSNLAILREGSTTLKDSEMVLNSVEHLVICPIPLTVRHHFSVRLFTSHPLYQSPFLSHLSPPLYCIHLIPLYSIVHNSF